MFTNGRSTSQQWHIQTSDETRRNRWLHIFGCETLPVIGEHPRWQEQQGADPSARAFPVLAYDLALSELSEPQRARFAGYLSRKYRMEYQAVLAELETAVSWPIKATFDIQVVVEPAKQPSLLASLLPIGRPWWKRPLVRLGW